MTLTHLNEGDRKANPRAAMVEALPDPEQQALMDEIRTEKPDDGPGF